MIIYNQEWLRNKRVVDLLKTDQEAGNITIEEFKLIQTAHPVGFYLPGIVVRVGLFILTLIIALFGTGFLSLLGFSTHLIDSPGWPIFLGFVCYGALEFFVREKHYFHSGVDNALLYFSACLIGGGVLWFVIDMHVNSVDTLLYASFLCIFCLLLTLRFADIVTAAVSLGSFFAFIYYAWAKAGSFGMATMPFVMMLAAGGMYYIFTLIAQLASTVNYALCISVGKVISLVTLYAAGNYFVVNQLNNLLHGLDDSHTTIPLGFIFWLWTILVPVAYALFGIKNKNSMLLRLGLILAGVSVATVRNYYHLLPIEVMLTLSGIILLAAAYTIISYLKTPRNGFTYAEPEKAGTLDNLNIEGLIIGETTSNLPPAQQGGTHFGGGSGGGGGSSGDF
jgi:hypothetical protein